MVHGLYSNGDSVTWGAELNDKRSERFSSLIANKFKLVDCNNSSAGISNDYIYRQTLRDIHYWLKYKKIWSEDTGWVICDNLFVLIGWTAPTRFEWWQDSEYIQERLWADYDKWGLPDKDKETEFSFIINQTLDIPSYIRTFNHIISLSAVLDKYKIPYYFFNVFYEYYDLKEPTSKIDKYGRCSYHTGLETLYEFLPESIKGQTMYNYINKNGGKFLPRNHPTKESHKLWANYLIKNINI
jgi:hypothetical protein